MTFQKTFILEKLNEILINLDETKQLFKFSDREILNDYLKYRTAERLFQLIVDSMLSVNHHLIKELNLKISEDLQETFYVLGKTKILPKYFTLKIAPIVGLRNRIVHHYESIDKMLFIKTFRKNYLDFEKYIKLISQYIDKKK